MLALPLVDVPAVCPVRSKRKPDLQLGHVMGFSPSFANDCQAKSSSAAGGGGRGELGWGVISLLLWGTSALSSSILCLPLSTLAASVVSQLSFSPEDSSIARLSESDWPSSITGDKGPLRESVPFAADGSDACLAPELLSAVPAACRPSFCVPMSTATQLALRPRNRASSPLCAFFAP